MPNPKTNTASSGRTASAKNNAVTLLLTGDVMTGRGIDQALPCSVDPILYEPYIKDAKQYVKVAEAHSGFIPPDISYEYIWGEALDIMNQQRPDARIINLETAVTNNDDPWPMKYIHYRMHPENAVLFTKAHIDVCVLGNNHILDWGQAGLRETLRVLADHNLNTAGAGLNAEAAKAPAIVQTTAGRLLIFSYATTSAGTPREWKAEVNSPGVNLLNSMDKKAADGVVDDIRSYRQKGDLVIFSIHWSNNWGYKVPPEQRLFAHYLLDSGVADIIHGHSSHHPKGIEVYNDRLILYGCGDMINDYEGINGKKMYRGDLSLLYFARIDASGSLVSLRMMPMQIRRFRLNRAAEEDTRWLEERLNREGQKFGTSVVRTSGGWLSLRREATYSANDIS